MSSGPSSDEAVPPGAIARAGGYSAGGVVLHVDDDRLSRETVGEWLRRCGFTVWLAGGRAEAEDLLAQHEIDLVLSDIAMDGNARLEWVEALLARGAGPAIVLLTGSPEFQTACRAANLPVSGYLLKPPKLDELTRTVSTAIGARRQRATFLGLSREILDLLATRATGDPGREHALVERLATLAAQFASCSVRPGPEGFSVDATWRSAIEETIRVIQKTKDSFRSKDLGRLRGRLQQLLETTPPRTG
jgi:CheY-like chemotaxis protein